MNAINAPKAVAAALLFFTLEAHADFCSKILDLGLECEAHEVVLYHKSIGKVEYIRSTPVALMPNRFAIGCCSQDIPIEKIWLVNALSEDTELDGAAQSCRIPILSEEKKLKELFSRGDSGAEFQAIEHSGDDDNTILLELRGRTSEFITAAELCGTHLNARVWNTPKPSDIHDSEASFDGWKPSGAGVIYQIQLWDENG